MINMVLIIWKTQILKNKKDSAIIALKELNNIAESVYGEKIYNGSFDDKYRNEIAQAIMILNEKILSANF